MKTSAFIGSSGLKYELVEAISNRLADEVDTHPWKTTFPVGGMTLQVLVDEAQNVDFGIFIFGADDKLATSVSIPRDNVLYEAGLFAGILGTKRCLIVHDEQAKIPSDLEGMTVVRFNASASAAQVADAVSPALLAAIKTNGPKRFASASGTFEDDWWQFSRARDGSIERAQISFLRFRRTASSYLTFTGSAWTAEGDRLARFDSDLSIVNEESRVFKYRWSGEWFVNRQEIGADPEDFYGEGRIRLSPNNRDRASGRYTTRNDSHPQRALDAQTPVEYQRARPQDIDRMDGNDLSDRLALIRERLDEGLRDR